MKKLILLFLLLPAIAFAQSSMRDYPINDFPTDNDTLLGIDEQQDVANWAVNNFTLPGILQYIKSNSLEYLYSASDFTTANALIKATGSGKDTTITPVLVDNAGNMSGVNQITMNPTSNPGACFPDSEHPTGGPDQCTGYIEGNYIDGGLGSENTSIFTSVKIAGVKTLTSYFDPSTQKWSTNFDFIVPEDPYSSGWAILSEVPTKKDVYDKIETIGTPGDAAADGVTKGIATFAPNDFNDDGAGLISLDYDNGQRASNADVGYVQMATAGQVDSAASATLAVSPNSLGNSNFGTKDVCVNIVNSDAAVAVAVDTAAYTVPPSLNDWELISLTCSTRSLGAGGLSTDIQAVRHRAVDGGVNMLTTALSLTTAQFATTTNVNATNNDVNTGDQINFDVTQVHATTPPNGLSCTMEFRRE